MPSRRHQLQQLMAARWRPQQQLQTNAENSKVLAVSGRSKGGRRSKTPPRLFANGGGRSSSHGSRGCPLTPASGGRHGERRRPVYVGSFSYYSYRRPTTYLFFLVVGGRKIGNRPGTINRIPVNLNLNFKRVFILIAVHAIGAEHQIENLMIFAIRKLF